MDQWVYVSRCIVSDTDIQNAIDNIIKVGQSRNMDLHVTGALFFTGTHFAQLLEGPPGGMMALRSSILADPRHKDVLTVLKGRIEQRRFHGWSLAYSGPSLVLSRAVHRCIRERDPGKDQSAAALVDLMVEIAAQSGLQGE